MLLEADRTCGCVLQWRKLIVVHWVIGQRLKHLCTDAGQFLQCLVITVCKEGAKGILCCDITECIYSTICNSKQLTFESLMGSCYSNG